MKYLLRFEGFCVVSGVAAFIVGAGMALDGWRVVAAWWLGPNEQFLGDLPLHVFFSIAGPLLFLYGWYIFSALNELVTPVQWKARDIDAELVEEAEKSVDAAYQRLPEHIRAELEEKGITVQCIHDEVQIQESDQGQRLMFGSYVTANDIRTIVIYPAAIRKVSKLPARFDDHVWRVLQHEIGHALYGYTDEYMAATFNY